MSIKVKVLFVCLGNICRSPTAHGVFRQMVRDQKLEHLIEIDSAGTADYHIGKGPDERSTKLALERGIEMADLRARQVDLGDFMIYDYVIAMDDSNYSNLRDLALPEYYDKISMFLDFAENWSEREVPDPYYGGPEGFDRVFDMVTDASEGLLRDITANYL